MTHPNLFRNRYQLRGRDWLTHLPAEDRLVFSRLGHMALRARGVPLQQLGGLARKDNRCEHCGKFTSPQHRHICQPKRRAYEDLDY